MAYAFLYYQLFVLNKADVFLHAFDTGLATKQIVLLTVIILLMPVNWGLEAIKWKFLFKNHEQIPLWKAFQAVLAGNTIGLFTPNRTGEFIGRVFILNKTEPLNGILITIIGSISQLLTTIVVGSLCLIPLTLIFPIVSDFLIPEVVWGLAFIVLVVDALLIMLYLNVPFLSNIFQQLIKPRWINIRKYMRIFATYSYRDLSIVFYISIIRYIVFTMQFVLMLSVFQIPVSPGAGFILIAVIFLLVSAIPTIALSELGVRGSVAVFVFGLWFESSPQHTIGYEAQIIAASAIIWLINIVIPALAGSLFLFRLRFFKGNA